MQITHLQSVRMSFENVNLSKFKIILRIIFPKLLISYEMNLVTFILCKLHICKVFECLLKMLTLQNLKMSEIKFPKLLISYEMNLVTFILCKLHICKVFECLLKMLTL